MPASPSLDRRGLLRGLVTLPLIGGGVTLIGKSAIRVPLMDVAAAPLADNPQLRARYAWEAFASAMSEVTAESDGWHVIGGYRGGAHAPAIAGSWLQANAINLVPLYGEKYGGGLADSHVEIAL